MSRAVEHRSAPRRQRAIVRLAAASAALVVSVLVVSVLVVSVLVVSVLVVSVLVGPAVASTASDADTVSDDPSLRVALDPASPVAGEPVTISLRGTTTASVVQCFLDGRPLLTEADEDADADEVRLVALLPADAAFGETTLVVTSRGADGVVRSARQPVTVRPRDPWLDDATGGLAVVGLAVAVLALGTAAIVVAQHRRRGSAPSGATAAE